MCHSPLGSSIACTASISASFSGVSMCSLSTGPGMISFTAIGYDFNSTASVLVNAQRPAFAAEYAEDPGPVFIRLPEPIMMIFAASDLARYGIASRTQ